MKRKVKVDLDELAIALDTDFSELHQYLDLETGRIVMITEEIAWDLKDIYEEIYDEEGNRVVTLEDYLQQQDDPDWQKEMILDADGSSRGTALATSVSSGTMPMPTAGTWSTLSVPSRMTAFASVSGRPYRDGEPSAASRICWLATHM